LLGFDVSVAV